MTRPLHTRPHLHRNLERLLRRLPGGPANVPGLRPLDPTLRGLLSVMARIPLGLDPGRGPAAMRRQMRRHLRLLDGARVEVDRVDEGELQLPGRTLRYRRYRGAAPIGDAPLPALVYFHGGGFVIGDLDTHDQACRILARASGTEILSVAYRLAPEARFPAAFEDALAAYTWVRAHATELGIDARRIGIGGDSAGGNLSAAVCQHLAVTGAPLPHAALLLYPLVDFRRATPSHEQLGHDYLLTRPLVDFFTNTYLSSPTDVEDPRCSPLLHPPAAAPPTLIVLAGYDPLVDEGRAYADTLRATGAQVHVAEHDTLIHGFINFTGLSGAAREASIDTGRRLQTLMHATDVSAAHAPGPSTNTG